jgi:hypothetical protein
MNAEYNNASKKEVLVLPELVVTVHFDDEESPLNEEY